MNLHFYFFEWNFDEFIMIEFVLRKAQFEAQNIEFDLYKLRFGV